MTVRSSRVGSDAPVASLSGGVLPAGVPGDDALRELALDLSTLVGEGFFRELTNRAGRLLGCHIAHVSEVLSECPWRARTVAISVDGHAGDPRDYEVSNTPCAEVVAGNFVSIPRGVPGRYPESELVARLRVEGYVGTPLQDAEGRLIGILAVLFQNPIEGLALAEYFVRLFSARTSAELEWFRADRALRESERRLRDAVRLARLGHWRLDLRGRRLTWSAEMYSMHGADPAAFRPSLSTVLPLIHPEDRALGEAILVHPEAYLSKPSIEFRIVRPNGDVRHLMSTLEARRGAEGEPVELLGTCMDMTEHVASEQALRASEARFRSLFEQNVAGVFRSTLEGRILEVNDAFVKLFGYSSAEELKAEQAGALYPCPDSRAAFLEQLKAARTLLGYECELRRRDGSRAWTVENVGLVYDGELGCEVIQGTILDVTAQRVTERALRESERQLRHAANTAQLGIWHWDVGADRVTWSEEKFRIFGLTRETWIPTFAGYLSRVHADDVERVRHRIEEACRTGESITYEARIVRPDGEVRHLRCTVDSVRDAEGRTIEMTGTTLDLTDRVRTEEAREASERQYQELFETSRDGIVYTDRSGRIAYFNEAYAVMLGHDASTLLRLCCADITPPKWHAMQNEIIEKQVLVRGESDEYEKEYVRADGSTFPVSLRTWLRRDRSGNPMGFWTIARDISDRRRAEAALRDSEERFRVLADSLPDGMFVNAHGRFLYANPAMVRMLGATRAEDLIGTPVLDRIQARFHSVVRDRQRKISNGGASVPPIDETYLRMDGTPIEVEVTASACRFFGESAILVVVRDVSERKRVEESARRHESELAHVSRLATLGEMAAGLAHELNQPLTAIANFVNGSTRRLREAGAADAEILSALDRAATEALRAGEIIRRLREFVRRGDPVRRPESLNRIVEATVQLLAGEAREHGTSISVNLDTGLGPVPVDGIQIEQVLVNLVRNAMDAVQTLPIESRRVMVGTYRTDDRQVGLFVQDCGPGIRPELADRIFDSFFTTKPDGLGMGLSISRRIIEAHGGKLWAESGSPGGTFRFTLPVVRARSGTGDG